MYAICAIADRRGGLQILFNGRNMRQTPDYWTQLEMERKLLLLQKVRSWNTFREILAPPRSLSHRSSTIIREPMRLHLHPPHTKMRDYVTTPLAH